MKPASVVRSIDEALRLGRTHSPDLQAYALIDGARYRTLGDRLEREAGLRWQWLLAGTELNDLRQAGPALVRMDQANAFRDWLITRDRKTPLVSWLLSDIDFEALARHLGDQLFVRMPDGRRALFRYYNPLVRRALENMLSGEQRAQLMAPIPYWLTWQPLEERYLVIDAQGWRDA
ncbi:DUF4123 domain-containing protein [Stutzerimonas nitrititolerans]